MVQYYAPTAKNMATPRHIVPFLPFASSAGMCTNLALSRLINLIQIQKIWQLWWKPPVSLVSCISEIFEKLLIIRIQAHLQARNTVPSHQFGFRQNHGLIEQVNRITTEIRTSFEHKENGKAVFLDVQKTLTICFAIPLWIQSNTTSILTTIDWSLFLAMPRYRFLQI